MSKQRKARKATMLVFEPFEVKRQRKAYRKLAKAEFKAMNSRRLIVLQTLAGY